MKKKFDFSAEMNEVETIKSNPKDAYLEEENRLLSLNIKELASLNDNVHEMSVNLVNVILYRINMLCISTITINITC